MGLLLIVAALTMWVVVLLLPWRPWTAGPFLDTTPRGMGRPLNDVTVLMAARNEAQLIGPTLCALKSQGEGLEIVVVDDQSDDETARVAYQTLDKELTVVHGKPLPTGWSGKLWALEQGLEHVCTPYTLLTDADILLLPGILPRALQKMHREGLHFLSLMATPHLHGFWERLLMPAFVYFFKLLYPFRLSNSQFPVVAAAAGGFILLETRLLREIGGFGALRGALIDDCTLANQVKRRGFSLWTGLCHGVCSQRPYKDLADIWDMVARTAFTQLKYSIVLLLLCTVLMVAGFLVPAIGLFWFPWNIPNILALGALIIMMVTYLPTLRYYAMAPLWALAMPLIGVMFLAMTWTSAIQYWRGRRASWRGRLYDSASL
ncbi:MAG: glycosyltransferase [Gammaproteobacteria bacterium]|nr:glycosyltransferase [Gammaproteobacteria bacterium]